MGNEFVNAYSAKKSADAAKSASKRTAKMTKLSIEAEQKAAAEMTARLDKSANQIQQFSEKYIKNLSQLSDNFNPYDFTAAFESLHESVIAPLERDFAENVVPSIASTYAKGGSMQSGAYKETMAKSRQSLAETKAGLRAQERNDAINRNYAEYGRKADSLTSIYSAEAAAPTARIGAAPQIFAATSAVNQFAYAANTNSIAAALAAKQAKANIPMAFQQGLQQGYNNVLGGISAFRGGGATGGGAVTGTGGTQR